MNLLKDPVVLICGAILLAGAAALVWALTRLFAKKGPSSSAPRSDSPDDMLAASLADATNFRDPLLSRVNVEPAAPSPASPVINREVAERLEAMTQRLAEMQSVLSKQSGAPGAAGAVGAASGAGMGQGFSPETIDKLMRIIGNVVQQVDILQKTLNIPKDSPKTGA